MSQLVPLPIILDPAEFTPANLGMVDDVWGRCKVAEYVDLFLKWKGKIIATTPKQDYVRWGSDDGENRYWLEVTVWDAEENRGRTFTVDSYEVYFKESRPDLATLFVPSYRNADWVAYHKWYTTVELDRESRHQAQESVKETIRSLNEQREKIVRPTPARGQTYKVVSGRKHPKGTTGKLFWWGTNNWGESYGLAINDERDSRGKFKNVIFVASKNLEFVPDPTTDAALKQLDVERVNATASEDAVYRAVYMKHLTDWATRYGYDAAVTLARVIDVMKQGGRNREATVLATV